MNDHARSLLDRYVYAIRRLLPRVQRDDIAAELREILQSHVDDEESRTHGPLDHEALGAILKRFGQPHEVASRYGSRQYLIGPDIFPSYMMTVRSVLWIIAPVTLFMLLLTVVTAEARVFPRLLQTLWTALSIGLVNLGIVTLLFVYFGRASSGDRKDEEWSVDDLPEMPADPRAPLARSELIGSLVGLVLMLFWWLGLNDAARRFFGWNPVPIVWAPVWADVTVAAVSILLACIARELMGLMRPLWVRPYLASGAILNLLALLVLFRLLAAASYVAVQSPMNGFAFLLNGSIFAGLLVMSLGVAFGCLRDVFRLLRPDRPALFSYRAR